MPCHLLIRVKTEALDSVEKNLRSALVIATLDCGRERGENTS